MTTTPRPTTAQLRQTLTRVAFVAFAIAAAWAALGPARAAVGEQQKGSPPMTMRLSSPDFEPNGEIPRRFTCEGEDVSPTLEWSGVPEQTESLALIVDDPDAPDPQAPRMTWVHWVLYNLPAGNGGLPENVEPGELPEGTGQGKNDWKRTGYGGPCPPVGRHRYFFKLYALDTPLVHLGTPSKAELERAMAGHVLAGAELVGTYEKQGR